ncbi:MAG TPA: DUF1638 domain-containing protein, partial [Methanomassiliicoccales archaeon]|nr:DUF1638 domain-containing protein [Methanomassiliicoccales archaeon]
PTVRFHGDDCVGVYLTQAEYDKERKVCAGTFYATPYFAQMGWDYFDRRFKEQMGEMADGIDTKYIMEMLFNGYSRSLYVHTIGDRDHFEALARHFAEQLDLRYESRDGTLSVIEDALRKVKEIGRQSV